MCPVLGSAQDIQASAKTNVACFALGVLSDLTFREIKRTRIKEVLRGPDGKLRAGVLSEEEQRELISQVGSPQCDPKQRRKMHTDVLYDQVVKPIGPKFSWKFSNQQMKQLVLKVIAHGQLFFLFYLLKYRSPSKRFSEERMSQGFELMGMNIPATPWLEMAYSVRKDFETRKPTLAKTVESKTNPRPPKVFCVVSSTHLILFCTLTFQIKTAVGAMQNPSPKKQFATNEKKPLGVVDEKKSGGFRDSQFKGPTRMRG